MTAKKVAAERVVELIKDGMTVGLGSGTTATYAIQKIGEMVKEGLRITAVATSLKSEALAKELSIPVLDPSDMHSIDIAIDGADEIDKKGNLIKGGGGSLLREKIIAFASKSFYVMADQSKLVEKLGKHPLPVEVIPFAAALTLRHIRTLGGDATFRKIAGQSFVTDNGNFIVDCQLEDIEDPAWLDVKLKMIPGVVETGLFLNKIVSGICIGYESGEARLITLDA
jgi:ribose 5-phosphate isomerase A